jgi:hypothetical protein
MEWKVFLFLTLVGAAAAENGEADILQQKILIVCWLIPEQIPISCPENRSTPRPPVITVPFDLFTTEITNEISEKHR